MFLICNIKGLMLCMLTVFVNHVFVCLVPIPQFLAVLDFMVIALH